MAASDLSAEHIVGGLVAFAIGLIVGSGATQHIATQQSNASSPVPWVISGIALPIVVAIISAYFSASWSKKKSIEDRIEREQEQWLIKTISILQRVYLECTELDQDKSVEEYSDLGDLDELMSELTKHYVEAPGEINRDIAKAVFEIQRAYHSQGLENIVSYLRTEFSQKVDSTIGLVGAESDRIEEENLPLYR